MFDCNNHQESRVCISFLNNEIGECVFLLVARSSSLRVEITFSKSKKLSGSYKWLILMAFF